MLNSYFVGCKDDQDCYCFVVPQPRESWGIAIMDMSTHDGAALKSLTGENVEGINDNGREKNCLEYASKATDETVNALHLAHPVMLHSQVLQRDIVHGE